MVKEENKNEEKVTEEAVQTETAPEAGNKNKQLLTAGAAVLAIALVGGALYFTGYLPDFSGSGDKQVVATVNGEEITKAQLDARIEQNKTAYEAQGADLDDPETYAEIQKQSLEYIVNEELILQDAAAKNITASQEDIDTRFQSTRESFESEQAFEEALKENSLTRETLKENLSRQITVQAYLDQVIDPEATNVVQEDIEAFYSDYSERNPEVPPLEEAQEQIAQLLSEQKVQVEIENLIKALRDNAEVTILI